MLMNIYRARYSLTSNRWSQGFFFFSINGLLGFTFKITKIEKDLHQLKKNDLKNNSLLFPKALTRPFHLSVHLLPTDTKEKNKARYIKYSFQFLPNRWVRRVVSFSGSSTNPVAIGSSLCLHEWRPGRLFRADLCASSRATTWNIVGHNK